MTAGKTSQVNIRLENTLIKRIAHFESQTGFDRSALIRTLLDAAMDKYDKEGSFTLPVEFRTLAEIMQRREDS